MPVTASKCFTLTVPHFLLNAQCGTAQMGVTDVAFSGRMRVVLTGVMDSIPVVSAAQVSLVEVPRFRCARLPACRHARFHCAGPPDDSWTVHTAASSADAHAICRDATWPLQGPGRAAQLEGARRCSWSDSRLTQSLWGAVSGSGCWST